jgi:dihydroflavonol-4-reductase
VPSTLVTGATGFIGSHVVRLLLERGDEVVAYLEPGAAARPADRGRLHPDVRLVTADVRDRVAVRRAMRHVERVMHLAGVTSLTASRERAFSVNVEGTRIVLEEALRAGVQRAVLTSSLASIGPSPPGRIADERQSRSESYGDAYLDSKREAEAVALGLRRRGLPVVIVNPSWVMGAGGSGSAAIVLVGRFLRRQIPAYVDGTLNIVGVEDVARGHLLADELGVPGERYILGNRNFTMRRLLTDLGRLSGVQAPVIRVPRAAAPALAAAARRLPSGATLPAPAEVRLACMSWAVSNSRARRELRFSPSPHEDCLEATIAWFRERDGAALARVNPRQPLALRLAGGALQRMPWS